MGIISRLLNQAGHPNGRLGRFMVREMNRKHAPLRNWVLSSVSEYSGIGRILDLGCGGGGTIKQLSSLAPEAEIHGVDSSDDSIQVASRINAELIAAGRVIVQQGTVSGLPYESGQFDLALATDSHYFWPDLPADLVEVRRVLKDGGVILLGGAGYFGGRLDGLIRRFAAAGDMNCQTLPELKEIIAHAGYIGVTIRENWRKGWFCVVGTKPVGSCGMTSIAT